jgi:hypothetical protein
MPVLGSFGDIIAHDLMARIAKASATDTDRALRRAHEAAAPFIGSVQTIWGFAVGLPLVLRDGPKPLLYRAEDLGVSGTLLREAYAELDAGRLTNARLQDILNRSPEFRRAWHAPVTVARVWGPLGLFWFLLIEELLSRRPRGT